MKDVVIIGSGISGSSLARELSKYNINTLVLEKENDTAYGATKANSGISHGGYDPKPKTLMAKYNIEGNKMMESLCKDLYVPFKNTGSVVIAFDEKDMLMLKTLYDRGIANGIDKKDLKILTKNELKEKEPNISENAIGALFCQTTSVISPFELCVGMLENAVMNGVEVLFNTEVIGIEKKDKHFILKTNNKAYDSIEAMFVVNAAGNFADKVHNMIAEPFYKIHSRRGEYYILDKKHGSLVNTVVFQCPSEKGKGVLVSPTAHGNLIVGPNAYDIEDVDDTSTTPKGLLEVRTLSALSVPNIPFTNNLRNYSGNRPESDKGDFIVGESSVKGFYEIAGIKSPGLTSAPAIAKDMVNMLKDGGLILKEKSSFNPIRKLIHLDYLPLEERAKLIQTNPLYGRIVCRCEGVSEGEIIDAIRRPIGGKTIEGIKKRTRVCSGSCQGGFCTPRILEIIIRELGMKAEEVYQDKNGSNIIVGGEND